MPVTEPVDHVAAMRTLGEIVQAARHSRGMSLEDFAAWCGVAPSTVAAIEYGGRERREPPR